MKNHNKGSRSCLLGMKLILIFSYRVRLRRYIRHNRPQLTLSSLRAAENNNCPTLLVFLLSFCVTAIVAYSNMHQLPRLESEQKSGAIFGQLFFSAALRSSIQRNKIVHKQRLASLRHPVTRQFTPSRLLVFLGHRDI